MSPTGFSQPISVVPFTTAPKQLPSFPFARFLASAACITALVAVASGIVVFSVSSVSILQEHITIGSNMPAATATTLENLFFIRFSFYNLV